MRRAGAPRPSRESAFRREMVLTTALFTVAFLGVLVLGSVILIKDLGEKEVFRMLRTYSKELETSLARIPSTQTVKGYQQQKIVTTRLNDFLVEKRLFDSFELYDEQGNLVQKGDILRQGALVGSEAGPGLKPGQQRVELRNRIPIEVQVPIEPGKMGRAVLSVSQDVLARQAQEFRNELVTKILVLVGAILALLVAAYLYVLRVLKTTRRLEAEASERERLSYLGLLSSGMAHEIKNPLNSIQMNLQLLEEELQGGGPPASEASGYLQPVRREVRRLERLVNDFLLYARPVTPTLAPVRLGRTLEELQALVSEEARQKGVQVEVRCPEDLPEIFADDGLLRAALLNLLLNALHAEEPGGTVAVEAVPAGETVQVSVRDHGAGVPPELRERIFEIFFTSKPGGTGLGLPIARRIAEIHGGTLDLADGTGPGAHFVLSLPRGGERLAEG